MTTMMSAKISHNRHGYLCNENTCLFIGVHKQVGLIRESADPLWTHLVVPCKGPKQILTTVT